MKILPAIYDVVKDLKFENVLDAFAGTGVVSYLFKHMNKKVIFNDHLSFNHIVGRALIENSEIKLSKMDLEDILKPKSYENHPHFIEKEFPEIYYTNEENIWLDRVISNLYELEPSYNRDMGFWCLFQSCITKRPFSLFHRKNLNLRTREVKRSFGNKVTWDTPFDIHFNRFVTELNSYIIKTKNACVALNYDVMDIPLNHFEEGFDLVYFDPPYIPRSGENIVYRDLYHFLEGITRYDKWASLIDHSSKHKRIKPIYNVWNDKKSISKVFEELIHKFKDSTILLSHRSESIPSTEELVSMLQKFKKNVSIVNKIDHKYALSNRESDEVLILAY